MRSETPRSPDGGTAVPPSPERPARRLRTGGVLLLVTGAILGVIAFAGTFDSNDPAPPAGSPSGPAMTRHTNRAGNYSFAYPSEWKLRNRGATSIVTAPGSEQIVSFGTAPRGSLRRSARRFLAGVVRAYEDPVLSGAELRTVDGHRALAAAGEAVNDGGVEIRFLTATVAAERQNYGIVMYTNAGAGRDETLPVMQVIIDSFHIGR